MATATASKTKLKVYPLADRVAIRPIEETEQMKGGLYIPDTAKEKPIQGEVLAVGPGRREKGEIVPLELKVGDRVVYGKYSGTQVELEGGGDQDVGPGGRRDDDRDRAGPGDFPRRAQVGHGRLESDVAQARHRARCGVGSGGAEEDFGSHGGTERDRPGRRHLREQR